MPEAPRERPAGRFRRPPRILLYALLIAAAVVTLGGVPALEQAVREGRRSPVTLMVAPALLALFIAAFALRRFSLVRAGRYHAGKAFVQVGLMVLVLTLALPGSLERYRAAGPVRAVDLARHLRSADADARAMAAELARHRERKEALQHLPRLIEMLDDPSAEVRRQATATLIDLAGEDAAPGGNDARSLWRAWWRAHGADVP